MPLSSKKPSVSGAVRSFWCKLLDLPDDGQRLINSQLITASPSTSQVQIRYQQAIADSGQTIDSQQNYPVSQFGLINSSNNKNINSNLKFKNINKTAEQLAPKISTGEQVHFATNNNQNNIYCVSTRSLSRLAFEERESVARPATDSRAHSAAAVPLVGSVQFSGVQQIQPVPTPTQLTIATEPTGTKFTTTSMRPIPFSCDKPRPRIGMPKKGNLLKFYLF